MNLRSYAWLGIWIGRQAVDSNFPTDSCLINRRINKAGRSRPRFLCKQSCSRKESNNHQLSRTTTTNSAISTPNTAPINPQWCQPPESALPCISNLCCLKYLTHPNETTTIPPHAITVPRIFPRVGSTSFKTNNWVVTTPSEMRAADVLNQPRNVRSRAR